MKKRPGGPHLGLKKCRSILMQPKSQKYVSSPPVSYMKAIEIIIHNSRQLQTDVWAKTSTHQHLASRFKMLNQWLNFPSVLLSAIFTTGTLVTINKTDFSLVLGVLGGLVTILVTLSTHFDFAGSSNSHRQTSHALRRFDRRLNHFMHRLILRGGAGKIIDEEGNGISFNELTNPKQDDTLETSNLKLRKIFNIKLEELLEVWDQISSEYGNIIENEPDLYASFTGWKLGWWSRNYHIVKVGVIQLQRPHNASGRCYAFHHAKAFTRMAKQIDLETILVKNVDDWAINIEEEHSMVAPFNRTLFKHVSQLWRPGVRSKR